MSCNVMAIFSPKNLINSSGIIMTIIGVYTVYISSPINYDAISGGDPRTDWKKIGRQTQRKNRNLKLGVYLIIVGSLLQLASIFIPEV